jgi:hypothetical protein
MKAEWTNKDSLTSCETTGKSILVIDTPKECDGCPCLNQKLWECQADKKRRSSDERPSWCPLKPMPTRVGHEEGLDSVFNIGWEHGYNACLDDLGETE